MKTPFEATLDIIVAKVGNSSAVVNQDSGKALADFAQVVFDKVYDLYNQQIEKTK